MSDRVPSSDLAWDALVELWERRYGCEPPRCMAEYAEEMLAALA